MSEQTKSALAGAAALALALARQQSLGVPRPMWLRLLLVSTLAIGGWTAFMGLALLWLSAGEAAVLGTSIPVWVAFLAWPILGERLSLLRALSLAAAAMLHEPLGLREIAALVITLGGVAVALRSRRGRVTQKKGGASPCAAF